jgi:hypothetical protein
VTIAIAGVLLLFFSLGTPGLLWVSPHSLNELYGPPIVVPNCREETPGEKYFRGGGDKGKATEFSLGGEYRCERGIFTYGERWEYVNFVTANIGYYAEHYAEKIASFHVSDLKNSSPLYKVDVSGVQPLLQTKVSQAFENALSAALGSGRIVKRPLQAHRAATIKVTLRDVADADLLFDVSLIPPDHSEDKREVVWPL